MLTVCQATCKSLEASLHQEPPQPETSWSREEKVEKENQALKEQVNLLKAALGKDEITEKMAEGSDITQIGLADKMRGLVLCMKCGLETSRIPGLNYLPSPAPGCLAGWTKL